MPAVGSLMTSRDPFIDVAPFPAVAEGARQTYSDSAVLVIDAPPPILDPSHNPNPGAVTLRSQGITFPQQASLVVWDAQGKILSPEPTGVPRLPAGAGNLY